MDFLEHLPQDLVLNHILNRLDFTSRVRVRAVCRGWRDLSPPPVGDMPWLWLTNFSDDRTAYSLRFMHASPTALATLGLNLARTHSLLNLSSSTTHRPCRCPPWAINVVGSRLQYLTLDMEMETTVEKQQQRGRSFTIYNPFTGDTFQLPSTFRENYGHGLRRPIEVWHSIQFSSKPPSCEVAALDFGGDLYFCRPGDQDWVNGQDAGTYSLRDMIFYKGELYCIEGEKIVAPLRRHVLIDFRDVLCDCNATDWKKWELYLVESGEELLLVAKYVSFRFDIADDDKIAFTVHRVDLENGRLVRVDDLGDRMLFVQIGCSQSWSRPEYSTCDSFFTNNCIYFVHYMPRHGNRYHIGKFRLNGGEIGTSFAQFHSEHAFHYMPIWITAPTY